jgi:hypothetical protein
MIPGKSKRDTNWRLNTELVGTTVRGSGHIKRMTSDPPYGACHRLDGSGGLSLRHRTCSSRKWRKHLIDIVIIKPTPAAQGAAAFRCQCLLAFRLLPLEL